MKELYKMKLHDVLTPKLKGGQNMMITRVASGWIYTTFFPNGKDTYAQHQVFVPFDNHFQE